MQLQHPSLTKEQIIEQVLSTPEHAKKVKIEGKLAHKSALALAFERAVQNV
jgi:hypothetical protein